MFRSLYLFLGLSCGFSTSALADEEHAFRVCADPRNLPFSAENRTGFENEIAELWAEKLGLSVEYTWFPQRRGFIRNTLKAPDESGSGYKCDVVMGVAAEFDQLLTTKPYYRSTYAFVYAKGHSLDGFTSAKDFVTLDADVRRRLRIGAFTPTPGVKWLARYDMTEQMVAYPAMSGDPAMYPGQIIEKELASGRLDAVVVWGPIAGFFANRVEDMELIVVPLESEPGIQFDFAVSAGVRYGDSERKRLLEDLIQKTAEPMQEILAAYHVPLLELAADTDRYDVPDDD